jgi:hypothetical protein
MSKCFLLFDILKDKTLKYDASKIKLTYHLTNRLMTKPEHNFSQLRLNTASSVFPNTIISLSDHFKGLIELVKIHVNFELMW